jgi:hypothetical protein
MTPPRENVGVGENLLCEPMVRLIECRSLHVETTVAQESRDGFVNAIRINFCDGIVKFLVSIFIPYSYFRHAH